MPDQSDIQKKGLDSVDIAAGTAADVALAYGISSEIASRQKQELLVQSIEAGAEVRRTFLETQPRPRVDTKEYKAWLREMKDTVESAKSPFVERFRQLNRPLTQPLEVFRRATLGQKASMIGAIAVCGILVAAFVRKIRNDWRCRKLEPHEHGFAERKSSASDQDTEPIGSDPQSRNDRLQSVSNSSKRTFVEKEAKRRETDNDKSVSR